MSEQLLACLPPALRGATLTKLAVGLSGAGVYRIDANGERYVLKVSDAPATQRLAIQQAASDAGLTARIVHVDPLRRAVVSAFVEDRSFPMRFGMPQTRATALTELGELLRRVHALPIPAGTPTLEAREVFGRVWAEVQSFTLPAFARWAIERALGEAPPASERAAVVSHNDVNPTNLIFDGERVLLLDWDMASANDPLYDLAAIAVFLRMDDATCAQLIAVHDQAALAALPERFLYNRRVVAGFIGTVFFRIARASGHPGVTDATPLPLSELYVAMREGRLTPQTADGQFAFGLAMVSASAAF